MLRRQVLEWLIERRGDGRLRDCAADLSDCETQDGFGSKIVPVMPSITRPGEFAVLYEPDPQKFIRLKRRDSALTGEDYQIAAML